MAIAVRHLNGMSEQAGACLRRAAECRRAAALAIDLVRSLPIVTLPDSGAKWSNNVRSLIGCGRGPPIKPMRQIWRLQRAEVDLKAAATS